jgi:hypothetical protein
VAETLVFLPAWNEERNLRLSEAGLRIEEVPVCATLFLGCRVLRRLRG